MSNNSGLSEVNILSHIKKSANGRYKSLQGTYNPRIGGPYKGPMKKPVFRSKLEWRLMLMLDSPMANNVISWEYESRRIPYVDKSSTDIDSRGFKRFPTRHYVVDFIVKLKDTHGNVQSFWIEVKSIHDIQVTKKHRSTQNAKIAEKIRIKNLCKWMAASKSAKLNGAHFMVLTENELGTLGRMINGR